MSSRESGGWTPWRSNSWSNERCRVLHVLAAEDGHLDRRAALHPQPREARGDHGTPRSVTWREQVYEMKREDENAISSPVPVVAPVQADSADTVTMGGRGILSMGDVTCHARNPSRTLDIANQAIWHHPSINLRGIRSAAHTRSQIGDRRRPVRSVSCLYASSTSLSLSHR